MYFSHLPRSLIFVFLLLLLGAFCASFTYVPLVRSVILIFFGIFIIAEVISIYFSGGVIDYQFFVNLNREDIVTGVRIFKWQCVMGIIAFIVAITGLFWLTQGIEIEFSPLLRIILAGLCLFGLCYPEGPLSKLVEIYQITMSKKTTFTTALQQIAMENYVSKPKLVATSGKNIIVISLESFERGFLERSSLSPELARIAEKYTFYPHMPMGLGSSWTTASMYTYMTGIPLLMGEFNPKPLAAVKETQLVSLGDVLGAAGYQRCYVTSHPEFAEMGNIITMFGIRVISERDYPDVYPKAPFGLYDQDIFDIGKKELINLANGTPFALFISTISTHAPGGFKDQRMHNHIKEYDDNMDFVAASLDHSVGDFIQFLEDEEMIKDTVFYIFPDHLMMGAGTRTIARLSAQQRSLYMISNANSVILGRDPSEKIYQIDLPRLILDGAEVNSNATFLTDYLSRDTPHTEFIRKHRQYIAQLNKAALFPK